MTSSASRSPGADARAPRSHDQPFRQRLLPTSIGLDALGNATAALLKKLAAIGASVDPGALKRENDGQRSYFVGIRNEGPNVATCELVGGGVT